MKKLISTLVLGSFLFSPITALAAAPTAAQIIRAEFKNQTAANVAESVDMTFGVNYTKAYFEKGKAADSFVLKGQLKGENFPINETLSNAEFTYSLPQITTKIDGQTMIDSKNGFSLDARVFGEEKTVYLRLSQLDSKVKELLTGIGVDIEPIMGKWIRLSLKELADKNLGGDNKDLFNLTDQASNQVEQQKLQAWYLANELKLGSPVSIVSSGKITKNAAGEKVQTVRVKINPKWYPALEKLFVADYKEKNFDATQTEIKSIETSAKETMAEIKKFMDKTTLDLQVNLTKQKITGFGLKYKKTETKYRYDFVEVKGKNVEKKVADSKDTVDVQFNLQFKPGTNRVLEVPENSLSLDEFVNMLALPDSSAKTNDFLNEDLSGPSSTPIVL